MFPVLAKMLRSRNPLSDLSNLPEILIAKNLIISGSLLLIQSRNIFGCELLIEEHQFIYFHGHEVSVFISIHPLSPNEHSAISSGGRTWQQMEQFVIY